MTAHLDVSPALVLLSSLAARMSCILNLNLNLSVLGTAPETSGPQVLQSTEGCASLTRKNSRGPWESWGYQRPLQSQQGRHPDNFSQLCASGPHLQTGANMGLPGLIQKVLRWKCLQQDSDTKSLH